MLVGHGGRLLGAVRGRQRWSRTHQTIAGACARTQTGGRLAGWSTEDARAGLAAIAVLLKVQARRRADGWSERRRATHRLVPIAEHDVRLELDAGTGPTLSAMQQLSELGGAAAAVAVSRVVDEMPQAGSSAREPDPDDEQGRRSR